MGGPVPAVGGLRGGDLGWVGAFLYTGRRQGEPHSGAISVSPELDCFKLKCPFPNGGPGISKISPVLTHRSLFDPNPRT